MLGPIWGFRVLDAVDEIDGGTMVTVVVLERMFARWSALVYISVAQEGSAAPPPVVIRSGVGALKKLVQPSYTFADPCYFERATETPADYLGYPPTTHRQRKPVCWGGVLYILHLAVSPVAHPHNTPFIPFHPGIRSYLLRNASMVGEPTFAEAAAVLTPAHDYKLLGVPSSFHKWSCTQDGYIKQATQSIYGQNFWPRGMASIRPVASTLASPVRRIPPLTTYRCARSVSSRASGRLGLGRSRRQHFRAKGVHSLVAWC